MEGKILLISDTRPIILNQKIADVSIINCSGCSDYEAFNQHFIESEVREKLYNVELTKLVSNKLEEYEKIFINAEAKVNGSNRSELKAINFVYWLRVKYHYAGTIIIYGFLSANQILRLFPKYPVIHAPGNFYIQIDGDLSLEEEKLSSSLNKDNLIGLYTHFIKTFIDTDEIRHIKANWWAIKTMWDIHNIAKRKKINDDYPLFVSNQLKDLNNYLFVAYHKTFNNYSIADIINQIKTDFNVRENKRKAYKKELKAKRKSIKEKGISKLKEQQEYVIFCQKIILDNQKEIEDINKHKIQLLEVGQSHDFTDELDKLRQEISDCQDEIIRTEKSITKLKQKQPHNKDTIEFEEFNWNTYGIEDLHEKRNIEKPISTNNKFLVIDDMANSGWLDLYQKMFPEKDFFSLKYIDWKNTSLDKLKAAIKEQVFNEKPTGIILDIRLLSSDNAKLTHEELSGFKVLDYLNENFPYIPVLMTSASNKIWSFKESINNGAIGYWIKEGVDNLFTKEESITNYLSLKTCLNLFDDDIVSKNSNLQKVRTQILNNEISFWWERAVWKNKYYANKPWSKHPKSVLISRGKNKISNLTRQEITGKIDDITETLKDLIKHKFTFESRNAVEIFKRYYVQKIADLIESIHPVTKILSNTYTVAEVLTCRGDYIAGLLYEYRNEVIHNNNFEIDISYTTDEGKKIDRVRDFDWFFDESLNYLSSSSLKTHKHFIEIQKKIDSVYKIEQAKIKAVAIDTKLPQSKISLEKLEKKKTNVTAQTEHSKVAENINDLKDTTRKAVVDVVTNKEKDQSQNNQSEFEAIENKKSNINSNNIETATTTKENNFFTRLRTFFKKWFNKTKS